MARRMKRKTRRYIFNVLYNDILNWLNQAEQWTENWTKPIKKWPFLRTGIHSYDRPKTKQAEAAAPKLKNVDIVRADPDGTTLRIMFRKERLCLASFVYDNSKHKYVLIVHTCMDTVENSNKFPHKAWFLFFFAKRALVHALTQRSIRAGGYTKLLSDPDNIEIDYAGLHTIFGGVATTPTVKSTWLRLVKVRAIANKMLYSNIKDTSKRILANNKADKFIQNMQNLITANT